ncbi:MAG TPA: glucose-1-phosphate thymidylyltransferase [Dehalococcoidia bacterium]|nr:glucose-1-phosphate thymidylyltransferase [Dehalococcoidia bacterium]
MERELKGLVLSGGKGNRLRPLTYTGAKQLVPIANKPILFYAIEDLVASGIKDIWIIISPETGEQVRRETGDGARFGARIRYLVQPEPGGIAQAIALGQEAMGDSRFVTYLGDNFLTHGIAPFVQAFAASDAEASILLKHVDDPRELGVAEFEGERLVRVVEKPQVPPSDLAVIGIYMFTPRVFGAIARVQPSARGELEITDTIQRLLDDGCTVRADIVEGEWIDTGKHDDLLAANRAILETLRASERRGSVDDRSRLHGRVVLEEGCVIENSVISGPAIVGERTVVRDAYVGPFTSIGRDCRVIESEISDSVVMEETTIERVPARIENSLIGRNVDLRSDGAKPRGYQLVLGDYSRARLP